MIVGTAGHIDHGKTSLVRALTGVDTDRLPEEKKRGISIELGYAYLDVEGVDERIGFVDVPGHERFVPTMLAGATGIDHALLLVAADDGAMPQTREHLAALTLLGVERGTIVVTKADRASATRVDEVAAQMRDLVAATPLATAPLAVVSTVTGQGLNALRGRLIEAAHARSGERAATADDDRAAGFRLAIDRVFTLNGVGTVVTGTAHAGRVAVGDVLALTPVRGERQVRVRSIHAQDRAVQHAQGGQRVALGLVGIERDELARGQWLASPEIALRTERVDALVTLWRGEAGPLRSGTVVHVHHGTSDVLATLAVLDGASIDLCGQGRVQLVLRAPIAAWRGDRIVLRNAAAERVVAGGTVLDPSAPARYRRTPQRLASLAACALASPAARLRAALAAAPHGFDLAAWARDEGHTDGAGAVASSLPIGTLRVDTASEHAALATPHADAARERLLAALAVFHAQQPDDPGPDAARLRRLVAPRMAASLWRVLLDAAVAAGDIGQRAGRFHLPQHDARLSAAEQRLVQKAWPHLVAGSFEPPWLRTLATDLREPEALLRIALQRAARRGELHEVVRDLFYPPPTLARAAALVRDLAARHCDITAASFRDASGLGRKRAIQIVEYFDRLGLLRRVGDVHRLRADCDLLADASLP